MSLRIGIGKNLRIQTGGAVDWSAELLTYIEGLATPLSYGEKIKLNNFIKEVKTGLAIANLSDVFDIMYYLGGETQEASLRNLVENAHHCTSAAMPTFSAGLGFLGNGTTQFLNTNYNPSTEGVNYQRNNASIGIWSNTDLTELSTDLGHSGTNGAYLALDYNGSAYKSLNSAQTVRGIILADTRRMIIANRLDATTETYYHDKAVYYNSAAVNSTAIENRNFYICASNGSAGAAGFCKRQLRFAFAGRGLSQAEVTVLTDAFMHMITGGEADVKDWDAVGNGVTDDFAAIQALIDLAPSTVAVRIGSSLADVFLISRPLRLKENCTYIIDGEIKIQNTAVADPLTAGVIIGAHQISVTDVSKFKVGQQVTVVDDAQEFIRNMYFGWGGTITQIAASNLTLDSTCDYNMDLVANIRVGHTQSVIVIDEQDNVTIRGTGLINGNRYGQFAALPSTDLDFLGYWENNYCANCISAIGCEHLTINGLTLKDALIHGLVVNAKDLVGAKESLNISISNLTVHTAHDKNIMVRFTDGITFNTISINGLEPAVGDTWEDGLNCYSNVSNCTINGLIIENCRRDGFTWNLRCTGLVANNITTVNCATSSQYGLDILSGNAVLNNCNSGDNVRLGGVYSGADVAEDIVVNNLTIVSTNPGDMINSINIGRANRINLNNLEINDSEVSGYAIEIGLNVTDCVFTGGGITNHTGAIISQDSYDRATWSGFTGLVIS